MPPIFERWWREFQAMHPTWEFITLHDADALQMMPTEFVDMWRNSSCYADFTNKLLDLNVGLDINIVCS